MKVQCALLLAFLDLFECARILGLIPIPSYSHQVVFQPLWKELSLRGHQVTVLTTNPMNDTSLTNLTEIDLSFSYKFLEEKPAEIIGSGQLKAWSLGVQAFNSVADAQLRHHEVQRLIQSPDDGYDLVIAEYVLPAPLYFARKFNCPYIGVISTDGTNYIYQQIGNPAHSIIYPNSLMRVHGQSAF
ncbi:uncharacterized protein LOC116180003 [Photinus pyralis]|uniref:uncharacterized protein LOC116180003 n=1 Tax=Photinus pyralis TaxID=7054 RepID=UPI0012677FA4|nr:uncharacterized protein LOC116180003 [Photinus pyralis]